ncbi:hypothetical protein ACWDA3_36280 [Nonomuraea rubra]
MLDAYRSALVAPVVMVLLGTAVSAFSLLTGDRRARPGRVGRAGKPG